MCNETVIHFQVCGHKWPMLEPCQTRKPCVSFPSTTTPDVRQCFGCKAINERRYTGQWWEYWWQNAVPRWLKPFWGHRLASVVQDFESWLKDLKKYPITRMACPPTNMIGEMYYTPAPGNTGFPGSTQTRPFQNDGMADVTATFPGNYTVRRGWGPGQAQNQPCNPTYNPGVMNTNVPMNSNPGGQQTWGYNTQAWGYNANQPPVPSTQMPPAWTPHGNSGAGNQQMPQANDPHPWSGSPQIVNHNHTWAGKPLVQPSYPGAQSTQEMAYPFQQQPQHNSTNNGCNSGQNTGFGNGYATGFTDGFDQGYTRGYTNTVPTGTGQGADCGKATTHCTVHGHHHCNIDCHSAHEECQQHVQTSAKKDFVRSYKWDKDANPGVFLMACKVMEKSEKKKKPKKQLGKWEPLW